jgi:hypothetical protein
LDFAFGVILWLRGVEWNVVSLTAEFRDAFDELGDTGRNVGEFDDVAIGGLAEVSEVG